MIDRWNHLTILVIGEAMLDSYLHGTADRLCQEAPVPVVAVTDPQDYPGGAANAAANVTSLGGKALLLSVVGNDLDSDRLQEALRQRGVSCDQVLKSSQRLTLSKQRVVANSHLLARLDRGSTTAIAGDLEQQLITRLTERWPTCDAVLISDYGYGILTPRVIQAIARLHVQHPRPIVVDSKQLTAYCAIAAHAVKPNYKEAIALLELTPQSHDRANQISPYGERLLDLTGAKIVVVTLDCEGAIVFEQGQAAHYIPAQPMPPANTSGAGDTFVSALTLAFAAGASTQTATTIAATATAIVVTQPGTTTCSAAALRRSLLPHDSLVSL